MISTIRFLRLNPYRRDIGSTDTELGYGIHDSLVNRGIAEFVTAEQEPVVTTITESDTTTDKPRRGRPPRNTQEN